MKLDNSKVNKKWLYRSLLMIGVPVVLQQILMNALILIDGLMVASLGEKVVSAVGIGGILSFFINTIATALSNGVNIFTAQYYGKKDYYNVKKALALKYFLSIIVFSCFFVLYMIFFSQLIHLFTNDDFIYEHAKSYIIFLMPSMFFQGLVNAFVVTARSAKNTKVSFYISSISIAINVILNYLLIFGKFGFPQLNENGSAIATSCAQLFALIIVIFYSKTKEEIFWISKNHIKFSKTYIISKLKTAIPYVISATLWALGISTYVSLYGHIGPKYLAASQVSGQIINLVNVAAVALASTAATIIGNQMPISTESRIMELSSKILKISYLVGLFIFAVVYLTGKHLISLYGLSNETSDISFIILIMFALRSLLGVPNNVYMNGILRTGGRTSNTIIIDFLATWVFSVPLSILAFILTKNVIWIAMTQFIEEIVKYTMASVMYRKRKWIIDLTK